MYIKTLTLLLLGSCLGFQSTSAQISNPPDPKPANHLVFSLSLNFINQHSGMNSNSSSSTLLYSNPFIELGGKYPVSDHFRLGANISYTGNHSSSIGHIDYFARPEDDAMYMFRSKDRFRSFSVHPKAELVFPLQKFNFFWSAGPVLSLHTLKTDTKASYFAAPDQFENISKSNSHSWRLGARASTGVEVFLNSRFGLQFELGYLYSNRGSLTVTNHFLNQTRTYDYHLDTFYQEAGIVFRL